jgi:hypothetical protein
MILKTVLSAATTGNLAELSRKNYNPPADSKSILGPVLGLIRGDGATPITPFYGAKLLCRLPGNQIFYDSQLAVDTDGSRFAAVDATGQAGTAWNPGGKAVDADQVPYFSVNMPTFYNPAVGIKKGDIAAIIYRGVLAFAVLADVGGKNLGEGSLALHRALGNERVVGRGTKHERFIDQGIPAGVLTIAFPGSGRGHVAWCTAASIIANGRAAWQLLLASTGGSFPVSTGGLA